MAYPDDMLRKMQTDLLESRIRSALRNNKTILGRCKRAYGVEPLEVITRLMDQDVNCGICLTTLEDVRWDVDHDHGTLKVRGLLCHRCNTWLGEYEGMIKMCGLYLEKANGES